MGIEKASGTLPCPQPPEEWAGWNLYSPHGGKMAQRVRMLSPNPGLSSAVQQEALVSP